MLSRTGLLSLSLLALLPGLHGCSGLVGGGGDPTLQVAEDADYDEEVWLERLYQTVLGRDSDPDGYDYWLSQMDDEGVSLDAVAAAFLRSPEYQGDVVAEIYARDLKRGVDPSGQSTYTGLLARGVRDEQIEVYVLSSQEYAARGNFDPQTIVTNLYRDVHGRDPDPAGLAYWTGALAGGASLAGVASGFVNSDEHRRAVISSYYARYLGRAPDQGGWDFWTAVLAGGGTREAIQAGFVLSDEFLASTVTDDGTGDDGTGDDGTGDDGTGDTTCTDDQDVCDDGVTCIAIDAFCDGTVQCPDGSDESPDYCSDDGGPTCPDDQDYCDDGTCIPIDDFCDGTVQCPDGSDESPDYCAI